MILKRFRQSRQWIDVFGTCLTVSHYMKGMTISEVGINFCVHMLILNYFLRFILSLIYLSMQIGVELLYMHYLLITKLYLRKFIEMLTALFIFGSLCLFSITSLFPTQ